MNNDFIKSLAELRAKELFTKDFFRTCTDSWYLDEVFRFKNQHVGKNGRKPTEIEVDKYMICMQLFKDSYQDNYFGIENALVSYSQIIDGLRDILKQIEECKKKYKNFTCPDDIITEINQVGNYFVNMYNSELKEHDNELND